MTTELRLIFLAIGILIIGYIVWDASRKKNLSENENSESEDEINNIEITEKLTQTRQNTQYHNKNSDGNLEQRKEPDIADDFQSREEIIEPVLDDIKLDDVNLNDEENYSDISSREISEKTNIIPQPEFSDEIDLNIEDDQSNVKNIHKPETVITINVMANIDADIEGDLLLQELLTLGFKFGEMKIFHRNHFADGQGERWFSLANAFNPGEFSLEKMHEFSTSGLTVFMLLPGPQNPVLAFENMLKVVNHLAKTFGARLEDGSHSVLTRQRIEMYRDEIKNYQ
ncbi:MAG TPA: cell division protein ZipA [Aeromonadales bacterium]|nr:cell division protein ZipA [Aeromonadales bacterium]